MQAVVVQLLMQVSAAPQLGLFAQALSSAQHALCTQVPQVVLE